MSCGCKNETVQREKRTANAVDIHMTVRDGSHPLACEDCLDKHLLAASVLSGEFYMDRSRKLERALCEVNLRCAKEHAEALGMAEMIDKINASLPDEPGSIPVRGGGDVNAAIGELAVAEQRLEQAGMADLAYRARELRILALAREKTLESQRGAGVENKAEPARTEEH